MDTIVVYIQLRTVWPTVVRTDGWMERWIRTVRRTGACQGPEGRRYDSYSIDSTEYLANGYSRQHQPRRGKTRRDKRAGPQQVLLGWVGWVVPSFARCDLGRYLASRRAASGIVRYLDCTRQYVTCGCRVPLVRCPGPGTEPGPWRQEMGQRGQEQEAEKVESSRVESRFLGSSLPRPSPPKAHPSPKVPSPKSHARVFAHAHAHTPTHSDDGSGSIPICISICIFICIAFLHLPIP